MEYTKLGNTDIEISKLCLGCMSFGKATMHKWTLDAEATEEIVAHALELGINFFDTANCYSEGTSEAYLGRALKAHTTRDKVVIASKLYFNEGRLSKAAVQREIEGTLQRLGTDYLDLYIIHRFDYETPIEETMEALHNLVQAGKVRAIGASAMYGYQFHNMQDVAEKNCKMSQLAIAWHWAKGVASPIIGATKAKYLDDAAGALDIKLTDQDIAALEEFYVPHPIVGAINQNPPQGVVMLDAKK